MKRLTFLLAVFFLCFVSITTHAQQVSVNAADYSPNLAPGSLASAFGADLAPTTEFAIKTPLPVANRACRHARFSERQSGAVAVCVAVAG
jgi:hypothetical protein